MCVGLYLPPLITKLDGGSLILLFTISIVLQILVSWLVIYNVGAPVVL